MFKTIFNFLILALSLNSLLLSQPEMGQFEGRIDGHVFDKTSKFPLEYANIVVFSLRDSSQVNGTITNSDGYFSIDIKRPGMFYLRFGFIGYQDLFIDTIRLNRNNKYAAFNEIYLEPQAYNLKEVKKAVKNLKKKFNN